MSIDLCFCGHEKEVHDSMGCRDCYMMHFEDTCTKYRPSIPVTLGPIEAPVETVPTTDAELEQAIEQSGEV